MTFQPTLDAFLQAFTVELNAAWDHVETVKRSVDAKQARIEQWLEFRHAHATELAPLVAERAGKLAQLRALLLEFDTPSTSHDAPVNKRIPSKLVSSTRDLMSSRVSNSVRAPTDTSAFRLPQTDGDNRMSAQDRKQYVAHHFLRLAEVGQSAQQYQATVDRVVSDDALTEIDLMISLPFEDDDIRAWVKPLRGVAGRQIENDAERLFRFRMWGALLDAAQHQLNTRLAIMRADTAYEDFDSWLMSAYYPHNLSNYLTTLRLAIKEEVDTLDAQIEQLETMLGNDR
ncbi:MAG: hypothetical protein AAFQ99_05990 [Pseudomonadota bacterium]